MAEAIILALVAAGSAVLGALLAKHKESQKQHLKEQPTYTDSASDEQSFDKRLEEYRAHIVAAEQKAQEDFDKTVISLSGGALGISFAFLKDIVGTDPVSDTIFLLSAWVSWGLSVTSVLVSYYTSHLALRRTIRQIDAGDVYTVLPGGWATRITAALNGLGGILFLAGVALMIIFVAYNLEAIS